MYSSYNPWGDSSIVEDHTLTEQNPATAYDAGMLLQNLIILWKQGITLGIIKDHNVSHVIRLTKRSQEIIVTFDVYLGLQRKAMYNDERHQNSTKTLDFVVNDGTVLDLPAKLFLTNPTNKQGFINLLSDKINTKPRLTAKECSDDANRFIVATALDALDVHKLVIVKADNTDVLAMCLIASETERPVSEEERNFTILKYSYQRLILFLVRYNLLVLHGFFGNDCTSAFFNHPSYNALKNNWQHLTTELEIFKDMNATKDDIHDAGVKLVLTMYGCDINHYFQRSQ